MSDLPATARTKKEHIWQLLERGNYSPQEIAGIVKTPIENVYKETSRFRKSGRKVTIERSRKTGVTTSSSGKRQVSRTEKVRLQVESNELIAAPSLTPADLKVLYKDLRLGQSGSEIVEKRGFHPEAVEVEERRYQRLSKQDRTELLDIIINDRIIGDTPLINKIKEKYVQDGSLANDEVSSLLLWNTMELERLAEIKLLSRVSNPLDNIPNGYVRILCHMCGTPIPDLIVVKGSYAEQEISRNKPSCYTHKFW